MQAMWIMLACIFGAGFVGGLVNGIMTHSSWLLWNKDTVGNAKEETNDEGETAEGTPKENKAALRRPGVPSQALIGGVAAVVSWGLYGPLSSALIVGTPAAFHAGVRPEMLGLNLASFVGAILVGITGTRWLSNEVDKKYLRAAAAQAAGGASSPEAAAKIAVASPTEALHIAKGLL